MKAVILEQPSIFCLLKVCAFLPRCFACGWKYLFKMIIVKQLVLFGIDLLKKAASVMKIEGTVPADFFGLQVATWEIACLL